MTGERFRTWLLARSHRLGQIRFSAQEDEEWLSLQQIRDLDRDEYVFESPETDSGPTVLNQAHVATEGENEDLVHEQWHRFRFELVEEDVELLVDVPAETSGFRERIDRRISFSGKELEKLDATDAVRSVSADRVAGLDAQKQKLRRFLQASNEDWGLTDRTGVLLEGPPGTGKTELVIETCQELFDGMPVTISGPEILSKWVGESERLLRKKFDEARNSDSQVLYIDEVDAIARSRSESTQEHSAQLVAQLLVLLDGVDAKDGAAPKVIASTNLAEVLDPALRRPGRLGNESISFSRPNAVQRRAILHHYLERIRTHDPDRLDQTLQEAANDPVNAGCLERLAEQTKEFTGADLEDLFVEAATKLRAADGRQPLSESTLQELVQEREIQSAVAPFRDYRLSEVATGERECELAGEGQLVALDQNVSDPETEAALVARAWRDRLGISDQSLRFRTVDVDQLLGQDQQSTRERVIEVFHRQTDERLCLFIRSFDEIVRMQNRTPIADLVVETVHEQLLRWNDQNLLVFETGGTTQPLAGDYLDYGRE